MDELDFAVDKDNRTLFLIGEIEETVYPNIIIPILEYNEDEKNMKYHEPIKLYISSTGGIVSDAFALIDIINSSKIPIITYALGEVASAAIYVLMAGHKRFAYPNTIFLIHSPSWALTEDKFGVLRGHIKAMDKIEEQILKLFIDKSNIDEAAYKNIGTQELWINAREALEYGIIDQIL